MDRLVTFPGVRCFAFVLLVAFPSFGGACVAHHDVKVQPIHIDVDVNIHDDDAKLVKDTKAPDKR